MKREDKSKPKNLQERKRKLAEFKKLDKITMKSDMEKYGLPVPARRINPREFEEFITSIGDCQVEVWAVFFDLLNHNFLDFKRKVAEVSGKDVVSFFEKAMKTFHLPFQKVEISFYKIPFSVEYRQRNFAHLMVRCGKATLPMADYDLFVRGL